MQPSLRWTLIGVAAIWITVIVTSFFAPDMVTGSQQEHLKVPALINWLWGVLATMALLRALRYRREATRGAWILIGMSTVIVWLAVLIFSLWGPVIETGTDPTIIPLAAIIAPIAGMLLTRFLVEFVIDVRDSFTSPVQDEPEPVVHPPTEPKVTPPREEPFQDDDEF